MCCIFGFLTDVIILCVVIFAFRLRMCNLNIYAELVISRETIPGFHMYVNLSGLNKAFGEDCSPMPPYLPVDLCSRLPSSRLDESGFDDLQSY